MKRPMQSPAYPAPQAAMTSVRRIGPCQSCGVVRFRDDGKREPAPVCGFCAAREILADASWSQPTVSHDRRKVEAAREYVQGQSDLALRTALLCDAKGLATLKARLAHFQPTRKAAA